MKVTMRHPRREVELEGPVTVGGLLAHLRVLPESVLVIRGDELLVRSDRLDPDDKIELRPVISGGA